MSEMGDSNQAPAVPGGEAALTAGQLLRQARETQHVTLEALAASLKVPQDKLVALETDQWARLPDVAFTRALAKSVCRVLGIDAAPVLALLPQGGASKLASNPEGINAPFKAKALRSNIPEPSNLRAWKLGALLVILAAGAAALYWLPHWSNADAPAAADSAEVAPAASETAPQSAPAALAPAAPAVQPMFEPALPELPATPAAPESAPAAVAVVPAVPALPEPGQTPAAAPEPAPAAVPAATPGIAAPVQSEVAASAQPAAAPAVAPVPGQAALRMQATATVWVQVRNAQRKVVLEKTLQPGDVVQTTAERPLSVVIGKAGAATVEVDGAAFDLAAVAKGNVARFEVK